MATKEQIEQLRKMLDEAQALMNAAAQFAGENKIPLKYIDEYYEEEFDEEEEGNNYDYDEDGPKLRFGGQGFSLEKQYHGNVFYWHNSSC